VVRQESRCVLPCVARKSLEAIAFNLIYAVVANPKFSIALHHHIIAGRYPAHEARKRIEREHGDELAKLHTGDGDFHHGVHAGVLAAARLFQQEANNDQQTVEKFPHVTVDDTPPPHPPTEE